jgi:glycosyltransferase involved in cell wall biosynthesis
MRRVLLVTSSYTPITIADMHRVRHLAWELPKLGWEVEVLSPNIEFQRSEYFDPDSAELFNPDILYHEVAPQDFWFFHPLKIRSIGWRALQPMYKAGVELLGQRKYDLIYLSTTNFTLFCLGRRWFRQFKIPYILDYHDPWVRDGIRYKTTRHVVKMRVGAMLSRWMEKYAIDQASGIVSVSPIYINELRQRYGKLLCLQEDRCEVIPFAASEKDLLPMKKGAKVGANQQEIIYVGAGGSIMEKSFKRICAALAEVRKSDPDLLDLLKIRLFGTYPYWKEGDPLPLQDIARHFGLEDIVEEIPPRITYLKAMELARCSAGLLVLGVDDAGYMPSKLFNYVLLGKPMLACFRSDSPPVQVFGEVEGLGHLLTFDLDNTPPTSIDVITMRNFLSEINQGKRFDRKPLIANYLAPEMARRHAVLFDRICDAREKS